MSAERKKLGAGASRAGAGRFTTREVARLAKLTPRKVRGWVEAGILAPARGPRRRYEFAMRDLLLLRAARELHAAGLGAHRIARLLRAVESQLPAGRDLSSVRLRVVDDGVLASDGRRAWDAASGQMLFGWNDRGPGAEVVHLDEPPPDDGETADDAAAWKAFARAQSLERRVPAEAMEAYREVLRLDPRAVPALVNLGRLEHEAGRWDEAERLYREALSIDPTESNAAFNLAVLAEDRGDLRLAIRRYESMLRVAPESAEAHRCLARLHTARGDREAARRHSTLYRRLLRRG
ncbi:MAG: tetratricopeptide repeat protein [Alphaproteobacteria bacterium]